MAGEVQWCRNHSTSHCFGPQQHWSWQPQLLHQRKQVIAGLDAWLVNSLSICTGCRAGACPARRLSQELPWPTERFVADARGLCSSCYRSAGSATRRVRRLHWYADRIHTGLGSYVLKVPAVYHLVTSHPVAMNDVLQWTAELGATLEPLSDAEW